MKSTHYSSKISMKVIDKFSKKHSNYISNFMKIPLGGTELFLVDGRTDIHDKANTRFSQLCERA
jgi:hypothetical protein